MARRSSTQITRQLAKKIIKKLKGVRSDVPSSAHDIYDVYALDGKTYLTSLSLRRGSRPDAGHDHMIEQLGVTAHKAKKLGQCSLSREDWIKEFMGSGGQSQV